MSTFVLLAPANRELDLAKLTDADFTLIKSMHGQISRGDRILLCQQAVDSGSESAEMYVKQRNGRYFAAHFPGSACTQVHEIIQESDEHRRQKDYWQRAAEDAGYPVTQELRTGNGTVLDVAIIGPRRTGIEVQHSALETRLAKSRTTRSFRAGWLPVWFLDSDHTPPWFHTVPAVNSNARLPWDTSMPPRRSATALGPSKFVAKVCTALNFGKCPMSTRKQARRPCGQRHPAREPWFGLTVDDVAAMIPAEQIVPMRDLRGNVHLVDPVDLALYHELTGHDGAFAPNNSAQRSRRAASSTPCLNHATEQEAPLCYKCSHAPAGPGGVLCLACRLAIENRPASSYYPSKR